MAWTEELPSFRTPGAVPFKWELQPGIPKQPAGHGAAAKAASSLAPLQLPPRLALPPGASDRAASGGGARWTCPASTSTRWTFAGVSWAAPLSPPSMATTTAPRHRRSMSARFATSLALPFTRPRRRGRSREEADVAFAALYGENIV